MENVLELENVTKEYAGFSLEKIHLQLPEGCVMGLIGENGAGKSTMIKSILGAVHPTTGEIRVLGCDNRSPEFVKVKEELGVVLDEACFPQMLTPLQVGRMMRDVYGNWEEEVYLSYLKKFELPENKRFQEFSKGMKMKLSLAVALSHQAKLLLLDEATSGLDPIARDEMLELFNDFTRQENHSILISSHITSDLEKICDYIAFLHQGRLVFCEEKDLLKERYGMLRCGRSDFAQIAPEAVVGSRDNGYGVEALVERGRLPEGFTVERPSIEEIIIYMAKEARR